LASLDGFGGARGWATESEAGIASDRAYACCLALEAGWGRWPDSDAKTAAGGSNVAGGLEGRFAVASLRRHYPVQVPGVGPSGRCTSCGAFSALGSPSDAT